MIGVVWFGCKSVIGQLPLLALAPFYQLSTSWIARYGRALTCAEFKT